MNLLKRIKKPDRYWYCIDQEEDTNLSEGLIGEKNINVQKANAMNIQTGYILSMGCLALYAYCNEQEIHDLAVSLGFEGSNYQKCDKVLSSLIIEHLDPKKK